MGILAVLMTVPCCTAIKRAENMSNEKEAYDKRKAVVSPFPSGIVWG